MLDQPTGAPSTMTAGLTIDDLAEGLQARAYDTLSVTGTPGALVSLADRTGRIISFGYGDAELTGRAQHRMTTDRVAHAGSQAKLYIAVMLMWLYERNQIDLYGPAESYLPFPVRNPLGGGPVTVHDLITHLSGTVTDTYEACWSPPTGDYYREELAGGLAREYGRLRHRWGAVRGADYVYSTFATGIAGRVVECVMGRPFGECVKEVILDPLGMTSTAWPDTPDWAALAARDIPGHMRIGDVLFESPGIRSGAYHSCEMVTRPADQLRLLVALWRGGEAYGARILRAETVEMLLSPQVPIRLFGMDLGWTGLSVQMRGLGEPGFHWGHAGGYPFRGWVESRVYPHLGFAIAVTVNRWSAERHVDPAETIPSGIWCEWAARWMAAGRLPPARERLARTKAYATGLLVGERLVGSLGLDGVPDNVIRDMAASAYPMQPDALVEWSAEDFAAGVRAMAATGGRPDRIRSLLDSPDSPVGEEEMELFGLMWGRGRAENPLLIRVLSDRSAEQSGHAHLRLMRSAAFDN